MQRHQQHQQVFAGRMLLKSERQGVDIFADDIMKVKSFGIQRALMISLGIMQNMAGIC